MNSSCIMSVHYIIKAELLSTDKCHTTTLAKQLLMQFFNIQKRN